MEVKKKIQKVSELPPKKSTHSSSNGQYPELFAETHIKKQEKKPLLIDIFFCSLPN